MLAKTATGGVPDPRDSFFSLTRDQGLYDALRNGRDRLKPVALKPLPMKQAAGRRASVGRAREAERRSSARPAAPPPDV
jgi:hypothetical protein